MKRFGRFFLWLVGGTTVLLLVSFGALFAALYWNASSSQWPTSQGIVEARRSTGAVRDAVDRQAQSWQALVEDGDSMAGPAKQVLFGDLHVHTSYSADAMVQGLPILRGEGVHPPADACDFARFCSALDFFSINDHAESLSPAEWSETKAVIRSCNAAAGDPFDPDLVAFLGWEWSQSGATPEQHFGHKNVILLDTAEGRIPARPIASSGGGKIWPWLGLGLSLADLGRWGAYADLHRSTLEGFASSACPQGVDVRDLPDDCHETAPTPADLFEKLDQWDFPALVIPHGLAWGVTNPRGNDLALQLSGDQHDPRWQPLIEVYSGHGNSEVFAEIERPYVEADTRLVCPEPSEHFEPCCWRAGEIARSRCTDPTSAECEYRVEETRKQAAGTGPMLSPTGGLLGSTIEEFGDCGQLRGAFLPAFAYRPGGSAQYALARADFTDRSEPHRFRLGFIASSDNHRARAGSGYKEFGRLSMTDGMPLGGDLSDDRRLSFYYTGGLVAVHAPGRDRRAIFDALRRREVYGTSGDRILLWFDMIEASGGLAPMGSEVRGVDVPRFEVRAVGAFVQRPGCPREIEGRLSPERLARLCLGECYHPGEKRKEIRRIEVVRIRPQIEEGESVAPLIEDPWKVLECPADPAGCRVAFEDPEFAASGREAVYYVRAIQEASPAVNGDPLDCERDAAGICLRGRICGGGGEGEGPVEDCLAPVEERAWSSPIFVRPD